ncbi:LysR family transcriptional regulator [Paracoccus stylophorae]|uniref:LysR family transcriptional regulator n=1 Tax=Paracoccus stylophorae TaxID=659350 RepID=A0ABY7SZ38_9RHOB|nr:LysR family transcriptional regulator [Paracoccus stylophorae]WCR12070.1 LysR family transcriptional regulator [Paracoccus stylophorae]
MASPQSRIVERALTRLKLRQLRLLVAVGRHGNIRNAAQELGISQPAATKMIQDLELDFEVELLRRTNRGVIPTVSGEALIRHGKLIFAQVSNAAQELDDLNEGSSGRVVIGTLLAASPSLLPVAVARLLAERPNVAIKIVEGTNEILMPALISGEIDMVVGRLPVYRHRSTVVQEKFFDERVVMVAGPDHALAGKPVVTPDEINEFGWILPPNETTLRRQVDQFFIRQGKSAPKLTIESVSFLTNRALLRRNEVLGLMPADVAALDVAAGLLAQINWTVPFGAGPVGVSHRGEDSLSPAGMAFLDLLRSTAQQRE